MTTIKLICIPFTDDGLLPSLLLSFFPSFLPSFIMIANMLVYLFLSTNQYETKQQQQQKNKNNGAAAMLLLLLCDNLLTVLRKLLHALSKILY